MTAPPIIDIPYRLGTKFGASLASGDSQGGIMELIGTLAIVGLGAMLIGAGMIRLFGRRAAEVAVAAGKVAA